MPIDRSLLPDYFAGKRKHVFYTEAVKMAEAFAPHADGIYPAALIDERRPNEPMEVKDYRKKVWKPKTKPTFGRILSSLGKIRRSSDWSINFPKKEYPLIRKGETLEDYTENNFPYYDSVTNWVFGELLKSQLTDPNAICLVIPLAREVGDTDYLKPYPFIFNSINVIEYVEDDYVLIDNPVGTTYYSDRGRNVNIGKSFYYADAFVIERWDQINMKGDVRMTWSYPHGLAEVPFFKLYGITIKTGETARLNASRIADILPELDEACSEYSDLQAGKVLNMYPERWEYVQNECPTCRGMGVLPNPNSTDQHPLPNVTCNAPNCHNGYVATGPYSKILVRAPNAAMEGGSVPTPPAGYVEKDIAILTLMTESVRMHIFDGLAAINFQFLEQGPLNQSGLAKEVDKDELNNTVHAIAEDLVRVMDNVYKLIAIYRYFGQYRLESLEMVPSIPVPERFDILSANFLGEELDKAKKSNFNASILNALELEYAAKKFNADHNVKDMLELVLWLDPLSNIPEEDKMTRLMNKGIKQTDYIISSNIQNFIRKAIEADPKFSQKPITAQRATLEAMAAEIVASTASVVLSEDDMNGGEEADLDIIGKIPLAVQQLSLAATRASDSGNTALAATITNKINQLLGQVVESVDDAV